MSSANLEDAKSADIPEKSGDVLYIGQNTHFSIGNGYAWIMIDWESLSPDNKQKFINGDIVFDKVKYSYNKYDYPIKLTKTSQRNG